jgi:hypothetical protein
VRASSQLTAEDASGQQAAAVGFRDGRRSISPAVAAGWAKRLGYVEAVWVELALWNAIDTAGLKLRVRVWRNFQRDPPMAHYGQHFHDDELALPEIA